MNRFGLTFLTLGSLLLFAAVSRGGFWWLIVWPAVSVIGVGAAYFTGSAGLFGKRSDGSRQPLATLVLGPWLLLSFLVWRSVVASSSESVADEVTEGLWIGRRPRADESLERFAAVLDLTPELPRSVGKRDAVRYLCRPLLDAEGLPVERLQAVLEAADALPAPLLVHCAQGHGRSALIVMAILLHRGEAGSLSQAVERVRAARPKVRLSLTQRPALAEWLADQARDSAPASPPESAATPDE